MELHRDQRYDIAWILSSIDHHVVAIQFFDKISYRYTSTSSDIAFTLGRVGLHNVVAVSIARNDTLQSFAGDIVDSLLREFPSIRAAFLISADGTVPRHGNIRVGDVVAGLESSMKSGVVYFDHQEATNQKRLFMTSQAQHLPGALRRLEQNWLAEIPHPTVRRGGNRELDDIKLAIPEDIDKAGDTSREPALNYEFWRRFPLQRQPKAFSGIIASSEQMLKDPSLIDSIAASNSILCFETAAANIKSRPFMVVSGVASCSGDTQQDLPSNEVCKVVVSYVTSLVHLIDPRKLATEFPIGSYFRYETFDLDRPGFRLLRLESGPGPIKCHVFQAYLDDEASLIPYEALSYCWGSNLLTSTITVNEKVLFITENLAEALQHLRGMDEDRILWIDAICIDQSNIPERGHQVVCMSQIYNRADRVLIWLGFVNHDLSHLISALKRFEATVDRTHPGAWRNWSYGDPRWLDVWENTQTYLRGRHESDRISQQSRLRLLMSQSWFGRVWILQEVAKAKKARLGCSEGWISAGSFALAPRLLGVAPDTQCQAITDIMPGPSRRSSWWTEKQNLCTLLWRFRGSQATDPRDRLYALLDLASDMKIKERITADYTKNEEAVVKDILAYLFNDDLSSNDLIRAISVEVFFNTREKKVRLTHDAIWAARQNGIDPLTLMVKENRDDIEITEELVKEAARMGSDTFKLLLNRRGREVKVTEALVEEVARTGPDTFKLLLDRRGDEVEITEALVEKVAQTESATLKLLLERRWKDITVTKHIIQIVRENGIDLKTLVEDQSQGHIEITEALVEEAARMGSDMLKLLLDRRGKDIRITKNIIRIARWNDAKILSSYDDV
ncbi:heterokaryon incompatibility protein-domain-containing protein [Fusarium oxysporum]|nr:heterokaryon incompatibility protein-domain-containing protein [Fusarium oxysporum]